MVPPSHGVTDVQARAMEVEYDLTFVSFKVLSLFDPQAPHGRKLRAQHAGMMIAGKRDIMKEQLLKAHAWAVGLQETRLPTSAVLPDQHFLMLNSASTEAGTYGCSLWLNLHEPYAEVAGRKLYLDRSHVTVAGHSPRHLLVQVEAPRLSLTILVAHPAQWQRRYRGCFLLDGQS